MKLACIGQPAEGKTRNATATRKAILEAARTHFLKAGYDNAGVRAIAADAGIDAALISRYFGSKKKLFAEVLECSNEESVSAFAGDRATCGRRMAEAMLNPTRKSANCMNFIMLVTNSGSSAEAGKLLHRHIEKSFMVPFAEWLGGDKAMENAWMIASMLMGSVIMNNMKKDRASIERLAEKLQAIIDTSQTGSKISSGTSPAGKQGRRHG